METVYEGRLYQVQVLKSNRFGDWVQVTGYSDRVSRYRGEKAQKAIADLEAGKAPDDVVEELRKRKRT